MSWADRGKPPVTPEEKERNLMDDVAAEKTGQTSEKAVQEAALPADKQEEKSEAVEKIKQKKVSVYDYTLDCLNQLKEAGIPVRMVQLGNEINGKLCGEKTWIMKIAIRVCYDMNHSGWFRFMNRSVTPEMLPGEAVTEEEKNDAELAEAVKKLPFKLREVILLYYYQGMNVNEIADALNISHSSVSGRLKRGKEKLKNMLEGRELDE